MAKMTPPLLTKGRYTLVSPFLADAAVLYTCVAIRTFEECRESGLDVLNDIYIPNGLSVTEYNRDLNAKAIMVTLFSDENEPIYVPDTYIESYPNFSQVNYSHTVLSVSLGAVPDFLNFTNLKELMAGLVSDVTGVVPTVKLHRAASTGVVTPEEHEAAEAARVAAIRLRTSDRAERLKMEAQVQRLEEQNRTLTELCIANGLLNP